MHTINNVKVDIGGSGKGPEMPFVESNKPLGSRTNRKLEIPFQYFVAVFTSHWS
jgi:hypothetical protein